MVVKNTLFEKALEATDKADEQLIGVLSGATSIMFSSVNKAPAQVIKEFRKKNPQGKPVLKAAYVEDCIYVGDRSHQEPRRAYRGYHRSAPVSGQERYFRPCRRCGTEGRRYRKSSRREEQLAEVLPASVQKETAATAA